MYFLLSDTCFFGHIEGQPKIEEKSALFFKKHVHMDRYEILYLIRGDVSFHVQNKVRTMQPGDLVFVKPGSFHYVSISPSLTYERFVLDFQLEQVPGDIEERRLNEIGPFFAADEEIYNEFRDAEKYMSRIKDKEGAETIALSLAGKLLIKLMNMKPAASVSESNILDKILIYIDSNLERKISLTEISSQFHYSVSYLSSLFTRTMHVSPLEYINSRKCRKAADLLLHGSSPKEAGKAVGFNDYSTFYRAFKENMGSSPKKYLLLHR